MRSSLCFSAALLTCVFAYSAFGDTKATAPKKQPTLKIDTSPVTEGRTPGVASYADVIEPVQKAVVSVYSSRTIRHPVNPLFPMFGEGDMKERGLGSGVIVSKDGYIITNNHVVEGADELNVQLTDNRQFKATVIGADPKTDVAVIRIDVDDLPSVVLADSDKLRVGDVVFAVGNPLAIGQTVTMGIVSATGREVGILEEVAGYESFIQTDAAINQGNSGGALIDAKGRLIGINSAILSTTRGNIGIGFAVPINLAATIMHSLIETGSVTRGFLGVQVDPLSAEIADALKLKKEIHGVIVNTVTPGGPAEKAGVKIGDVVLTINEKPVSTTRDLRMLVAQLPPDSEAHLKILRDGQEKAINVKLGKLSDAGRDELLTGVHVLPLSDQVRHALNLDGRVEEGLVISEVDPNSPYSDRLQPKMVIVEINRVPVADVDIARQLLEPGRNLLRVIVRGQARYVPVFVK